ncbi:MAG TPA: PEGA domain-containing protein [bacterium]
MAKFKLSIVLTNFLILVTVFQLDAQQDSKKENDSKTVTIASVPAGALVEISGSHSYVGRTPYVIPYDLAGRYKIKASKEGYETLNSNLILAAQRGVSHITVRLYPKTRFKAAIRSLSLAGWGQIYGQNRVKGLLFTAGQASAGLVTFLAVNKYGDQKDDYEAAVKRFDEVKFNLTEAERAFALVQKEFKEADDALSFRNTMIYVTVGFWLYNVVDSILFFSKERSPLVSDGVRRSPNLSGSISQDQVMLTMQFGF